MKSRIFYLFILVILLPAIILGLVFSYLKYQDSNISVNDPIVTNITESAFTLTWTSDDQYIGGVVFKEASDSWTPILSQYNFEHFSDDRDVELNEEGEYVEVEAGAQERYTHHVSVYGLTPETEYEVRVTGAIIGKDPEVGTITTIAINDDLKTPDPAYGFVENVDTSDSFVILWDPAKEVSRSTTVTDSSSYSLDVNGLPDFKGDISGYEINVFSSNIGKLTYTFENEDYKPLEVISIQEASTSSLENMLMSTSHAKAVLKGACYGSYDDCNLPQECRKIFDEQFAAMADGYRPNLRACPTHIDEYGRVVYGYPPNWTPPPPENEVPCYECHNSGRFAGPIIRKANAQEEDLTVTESGQYAFFQDGEKIAEGVVVVGEDGTATVRLYYDDNGNGIKDDDEEFFTDYSTINLSQEIEAEGYILNAGWNLISLPLYNTDTDNPIQTVSTLLDHWNEQGADIVHIARFRNGKFEMYSKRETGATFTNDFALIPGEAYFVLNYKPINATFTGNPIESAVKVPISNGWNMIGIISPLNEYNSEQILDEFEAEGITADTITMHESGLYQSVIKEEDLVYGNNFNIVDTKGYFVRVVEGGGGDASFTP